MKTVAKNKSNKQHKKRKKTHNLSVQSRSKPSQRYSERKGYQEQLFKIRKSINQNALPRDRYGVSLNLNENIYPI